MKSYGRKRNCNSLLSVHVDVTIIVVLTSIDVVIAIVGIATAAVVSSCLKVSLLRGS